MDKLSDPELLNQIEPELLAGERLLWTGRPVPQRWITKGIPMMLFGIPWTGFSLFFVSSFSGFDIGRNTDMSGIFGIFTLIPYVFVIIGIGMLLSPLWEYMRATRTVYAVTDRRAIILSGLFSQSIQSYGEDDIEYIERSMRGEYGDIIFARRTEVYYSNRRQRKRTIKIGFFGIPNVREVEAIMLETFQPGDEKFKRKHDW